MVYTTMIGDDVLTFPTDFYGFLNGQPFGGIVVSGSGPGGMPGTLISALSLRAGRPAPLSWVFVPSWPSVRPSGSRRRRKSHGS